MTEGVTEMTVCFPTGANSWDPCLDHVGIGVVRCANFMLWRLAYTPSYNRDEAYCTTASGLQCIFDCATALYGK